MDATVRRSVWLFNCLSACYLRMIVCVPMCSSEHLSSSVRLCQLLSLPVRPCVLWAFFWPCTIVFSPVLPWPARKASSKFEFIATPTAQSTRTQTAVLLLRGALVGGGGVVWTRRAVPGGLLRLVEANAARPADSCAGVLLACLAAHCGCNATKLLGFFGKVSCFKWIFLFTYWVTWFAWSELCPLIYCTASI